MLKLTSKDYAALRRHGEETYPHECCGVLLGRTDDNGTRIVTSTARCGNTRTDSPQNRYNIDPRELVRIQREGRERGEDIVGFYHSHPDHPGPLVADRSRGSPLVRLLLRNHQRGKRKSRDHQFIRTQPAPTKVTSSSSTRRSRSSDFPDAL